MRRLFTVIFAWALFSTQAFAQVPPIAPLDIDENHIVISESLSPEDLEIAIDFLKEATWEDIHSHLTSLGVKEDELPQMTEAEWDQQRIAFVERLEHLIQSNDSDSISKKLLRMAVRGVTLVLISGFIILVGIEIGCIIALMIPAAFSGEMALVSAAILLAVAFKLMQIIGNKIKFFPNLKTNIPSKDNSAKPYSWIDEDLHPPPLH